MPATTIPAEDLGLRKKELRHTVARGEEVSLTFRGRHYGTVVPLTRLEAQRTELDELRARVAELESQLQTVQQHRPQGEPT